MPNNADNFLKKMRNNKNPTEYKPVGYVHSWHIRERAYTYINLTTESLHKNIKEEIIKAKSEMSKFHFILSFEI